jgi:hypothetical protein
MRQPDHLDIKENYWHCGKVNIQGGVVGQVPDHHPKVD